MLFRSLRSHLDAARDPALLAAAVTEDVRRAARLLEGRLAEYPGPGGPTAPGAPYPRIPVSR